MTEIIKDIRSSTKTTLFLVPILGITMKELKGVGFINGYCFMEERPHQDCIYLLFQTDNQVRLGEFTEKYRDKIVDEIDYEKGYTVLICPFPVKFIYDKGLFWEGSYSLLSRDFRGFFRKGEHTFQIDVMNKDKELRREIEERISLPLPYNSEVASIPDKKWETLDIQLFINPE